MLRPNENIYAVILAGGSGTRFWPKSRHLSPKQLCKIGNESLTMIELTLDRLDGFIPPERRIIVTHEDQAATTNDLVRGKCALVLAEPVAKNTAPALALAALEIQKLCSDQDAIMISVHADAIIRNTSGFHATLASSVKIAQSGYLALIGVPPVTPETGYGYIESGNSLESCEGHVVNSFREKPDFETAQKYLENPNLYWNSGIFTWKTSIFLAELSQSVPTIEKALSSLLDSKNSFGEIGMDEMRSVYESLPKISVDNAVLETSRKVAMTSAEFDWQDVGSWDALPKSFPTDEKGNIINGDTVVIDCEDSVVDSDGPLVACIGLRGMVAIAAKGAFLVCPAERAQEVKKVVEILKMKNHKKYL